MKAIIHFRIESFFAAIEAKKNPELVGKPIVVAKNAGSGGIIVSASPEAKKLGVVNGMTLRHAQRVCPDAVFIPADYPLYRSVSSVIMDVLSKYSPVLEPDSLDKAWVDVTGSKKLFGGPRKIAIEAIDIIEEIGYKASAGIAINKLVSQIASESNHTNNTKSPIRLIAPGKEDAFLQPLSVELLPSVGAKTAKRLLDLGVRTIGQLKSIPESLLIRQFGPSGDRIARMANGIDYRAVKAAWPPEVITSEHTFQDELIEPAEVEEWLGVIATRLAIELRSCGRLSQTIELKIIDKLSHEQLTPAIWRLKYPVNQSTEIIFALRRLLPLQMKTGMEVIGILVTLSDLTIGEGMQLSLLGASERKRRMDRLIETIHGRFGDSAIVYATSLSKSGKACVIKRIAAA